MPTVFDHAHLLDGALARACAYLALAVLAGMQLWEWRFSHSLVWRRYLNWGALALGSMALLFALNSAALDDGDVFNVAAMPVASPADMLALVRFSVFGQAWLAYWLSLLLAVFCRPAWLVRSAWLAMLLALALASHAGELGMASLAYWTDLLHMGCALLWLGGMSLMLVFRLADTAWISPPDLGFFSRLALPVFLLTLVSGAARAWLQYADEGGLAWTYAAMLGLKLAAVAAIAACAWRLRRLLRQPRFNMAVYDNGLTLEFFFALVLLLFTALLTQLPPG